MIMVKVLQKFFTSMRKKRQLKFLLMNNQTNWFSIQTAGCLQILRTETATKIRNDFYFQIFLELILIIYHKDAYIFNDTKHRFFVKTPRFSVGRITLLTKLALAINYE